MLTSIILELHPVTESRLPLSHGSFAHAAALEMFLRLDPTLAQSLHCDHLNKPFTVSPLMGNLRREDYDLCLEPATPCEWRLTGLNRQVSEMLLRLAPDAGGIRMGNAVFRIAGVFTGPEEHREAGQETYDAMARRRARAKPSPSVTLDFLTPTTFRTGHVEQPYPLPRLVFGHLVGQWNTHASFPLGDLKHLLDQAIVLGNWKGEIRRVELGGRRTVGFTGKFTYRALEPIPDLQRLLGEFAFYAGVGWQTAQGMGQVRVRSQEPEVRSQKEKAG